MGGEDAAEPVGLLDLADDNLADLLRAMSWNRNACKLALVLTCRRFRQIQLEAKMALRTSLRSVASSMTMLNWAVDAGCPYPHKFPSQRLCVYASAHCAMDVLRFALDPLPAPRERRYASAHCAMDVLRFALDLRCPLLVNAVNRYEIMTHPANAAIAGDCSTAQKISFVKELMTNASLWRHETQKFTWGARTLALAAAYTDVEIMSVLHDLGCPFTEEAARSAAERGHLKMLEWLAQAGAPMKLSCSGAQDEETLKAAIRMGGEVSASTVRALLMNAEDEELLLCALENCDLREFDEDDSKWVGYRVVADFNDFELVKKLVARGLALHSWCAVATICSMKDALDKVQWLAERGCPLDGRVMYEAVKTSDLPLMEWVSELPCSCTRSHS